jgi:hypothetical protein
LFCYYPKYIISIKKKREKREKERQKTKSFKKTFNGFCRRKLNKGKLNQINSKLAQLLYPDFGGPNRNK